MNRHLRLIALTALLLFAADLPVSAGERLRIVTFNPEILAAPGTRASRLERYRWDHARTRHFERVAAVIETLEPDILNLVEVTSLEAVDLLIQILHEKGLRKYQGYHVESNDKFTGFDVAVISKHPLQTIDGAPIRILLSPPGDLTWRERYSYTDQQGTHFNRETALDRHAVYYVEVHGHKLGFLGMHMKANPDDIYSNARRTAESQIAQRIVQQEIVVRGYTPIVLGDLNDYDPDVPDRDDSRSTMTQVLRHLKDYNHASPGDELVNVAERIERVQDRYTSHWDRNENGAEDPYDVRTMLDHILLHKSLMPSVRRVFISHSSGLDVSDHYPVVVDLELEPQP